MLRKLRKGDDVYVKDPQSFSSDKITCIVGYVLETHKGGRWLTIEGSRGRMPADGGPYDATVTVLAECCGIRGGTRISKISTQPGTAGYAEWCRISRSWGY
jgi:hypothetical protein